MEPTKPKWLKNEKNRDFNNISLSEMEINHPERKIKKKRTSTENPYFDNELKCPEDTQYRAVFHHANRRGIEDVKHKDGSSRCNNWFFRGWCTENCPMKESHEKKLLPFEKQKCKEYLRNLISKHKKWAAENKRNKGPNEG